MKYTNIFEKLVCLFNIIGANWASMIFLLLVFIFFVLLKFKKISKKKCFILSFVSYLCFLGYVIFSYSKQLGVIGDHFIDNVFKNIYFPSVYTYLFTLIVIDVTAVVCLLNSKCRSAYKWVHGIFFFIVQFIFTFILELLSKNKIDVFSKVSLFSNKDLVMMLELSMNIFVIWIILILFIYLTDIITEKVSVSRSHKLDREEVIDIPNMNQIEVTVDTTDVSKPDNSNLVPNVLYNESNENNLSYNVDVQDNVLQSNVNVPYVEGNVVNNLSSNVVLENVMPNTLVVEQNVVNNNSIIDSGYVLNDLVPQEQERIIPQPVSSNVVLENVIDNNVEDVKSVDETDSYTLNDYRLFNKMLKEIKEYNNSNTVTIDKYLEYRLITKYSTETYNMFKKMLKIYSN